MWQNPLGSRPQPEENAENAPEPLWMPSIYQWKKLFAQEPLWIGFGATRHQWKTLGGKRWKDLMENRWETVEKPFANRSQTARNGDSGKRGKWYRTAPEPLVASRKCHWHGNQTEIAVEHLAARENTPLHCKLQTIDSIKFNWENGASIKWNTTSTGNTIAYDQRCEIKWKMGRTADGNNGRRISSTVDNAKTPKSEVNAIITSKYPFCLLWCFLKAKKKGGKGEINLTRGRKRRKINPGFRGEFASFPKLPPCFPRQR